MFMEYLYYNNILINFLQFQDKLFDALPFPYFNTFQIQLLIL